MTPLFARLPNVVDCTVRDRPPPMPVWDGDQIVKIIEHAPRPVSIRRRVVVSARAPTAAAEARSAAA